jgi:hypothetical protein
MLIHLGANPNIQNEVLFSSLSLLLLSGLPDSNVLERTLSFDDLL